MLLNFAAHLRAVEGKSRRTTDTYRSDVNGLLSFLADAHPDLAIADLQVIHLDAYLIDQEARGIAASSRRRSIFAIRSFLAYATGRAGQPTIAHQIRPPTVASAKTDVFTPAEIAQILTYARAQTTLRGQLAAAITVTVWATGLRLSELVALKIANVDLDGRRLTVIGKGDKQRRVPIPQPLADTLGLYLSQIRPRLPGTEYLFSNPNSQPSGPHHGKIAPWVMERLVSDLCQEAGVASKTNLHKWRHTYATTVLRKSGDLHTVQRLLGHTSIQTTLRYLHLVDDDLRAAVDKAFE